MLDRLFRMDLMGCETARTGEIKSRRAVNEEPSRQPKIMLPPPQLQSHPSFPVINKDCRSVARPNWVAMRSLAARFELGVQFGG
jgi:hypothetical protein